MPEFAVGDRVVIKTIEEFRSEFKTEYGNTDDFRVDDYTYFVKRMYYLCGQEFTVVGVDELGSNGECYSYELEGEVDPSDWTITGAMLRYAGADDEMSISSEGLMGLITGGINQ